MLDKNENAPYIEEKKDRSGAYKVGQIVGFIFTACVTSIVIALTIKLVMWILGL